MSQHVVIWLNRRVTACRHLAEQMCHSMSSSVLKLYELVPTVICVINILLKRRVTACRHLQLGCSLDRDLSTRCRSQLNPTTGTSQHVVISSPMLHPATGIDEENSFIHLLGSDSGSFEFNFTTQIMASSFLGGGGESIQCARLVRLSDLSQR